MRPPVVPDRRPLSVRLPKRPNQHILHSVTPSAARKPQAATRSNDSALIVVYYVTLVLLFAASFFTEARLWGLNWWSYFPLWIRLAVFLVAAAFPWFVKGRTGFDATGEGRDRNWTAMSLLILAAALALFMLFRTRMHLLGDGFQLLARLASQAPPIRPWNPGVYFLQDSVYALLGGGGQDNALIAFRLISWSAGLLFVGGLLWTAGRLFESDRERLLFVLSAAAGGFALLFFGYVENYPMLAALIALFLLSSWLAIVGKLARWWPLLPLGLATLFHPFTGAMLPAAAYVLMRDTAAVRSYDRLSAAVKAALWSVVVIVIAVFFYWMQSGFTFLRFALVPWVADSFTVEGYTLLSGKHLLDFANLIFLFAPPFLLYLYTATRHGRTSVVDKHVGRFFVLAALPALAIALLFDPKLGMARDWDVFAFGAIPLTLWGVYEITRLDRTARNLAMLLAGVLGLMVLAPRLAVDASETRAIAWFNDVARLDKTKNRRGLFVLLTYYRDTGRQAQAESFLKELLAIYPQDQLSNQGDELFKQGKLDEAEATYREIIRLDPTYSSALANLAMVMATRGQLDSAVALLHIADAINPYDPELYDRLGNVYLAQQKYDEAEAVLKKSWERNKESFASVKSLMMLYAMQRRRDDYDILMTEAALRPRAPRSLVHEYANLLASRGRMAEAEAQYRRALAAGLDPTEVRQAQEQFPGLHVLP